MYEAFRSGGWPMYPILVCGLLLCAAAGRYALRPERRLVPLLLTLGLSTLLWGAAGFTIGLMRSLSHLGELPAERRFIVLIGLGESLSGLALGLLLTLLAAMIAALGAWRLAGRPAPRVPDPPLAA